MCDDIPAPPRPGFYPPNEVILYGIKLNSQDYFADIEFETTARALRLAIVKDGKPTSQLQVAIAVIYGYAFEGHCYRLDKSKIFAFIPPESEEEAKGCGFGGEYKMWRITPKTMLLELTVNVDTAQELVLNANLPGNRPPNTYGNNMQLAHRGGRIGRT